MGPATQFTVPDGGTALKLILASVSPRKAAKSAPAEALLKDYVNRAARYTPTEAVIADSEAALLALAARSPARAAAPLILFDSTGEALTSEAFAALLARLRDTGTQRLLFGIGPADGWSAAALTQAHVKISFGRITLPHELAKVIAAEQIYRALTILAGHPYHSGH